MIVGVIGNGYVGKSTQLLRNDNVRINVYDVNPNLCYPMGIVLEDMNKCQVVFVCVPTPMNKDSSVNTKIVEQVIVDLKRIVSKETIIVVRSTVPIGFCDEHDVYFMPEFLTEKNAELDFINTKTWILGKPKTSTNEERKLIENIINSAYALGKIKNQTMEWLDNSEAEMVKYFRNTFLSTKVSFCNEIYKFCQNMNINYSMVQRVATLDERIGSSHTSVPGHDGKFGFGGTCFPKDTRGLQYQFSYNSVPSPILDAVISRNENIDRPDKDWTLDIGRAVSL